MAKEPRFMTFRTRGKHPGRPKPGEWTDVIVMSFDENGNQAGEVIINSFSGSDGGASEARRLVGLLNQASEVFTTTGIHEMPPLAGGVVCKCPTEVCPMHGRLPRAAGTKVTPTSMPLG